MKAAVIQEYIKSPKDITIQQIAIPQTDEENDVLVQVYSCALSFADTLLVQGKYQTSLSFPYIPGQEFAGIVVSKHESSESSLKVGDRVAGIPYGFSTVGALSSYITCSNNALIKLNDNQSFDSGCGFPVNYATCFLAFNQAKLKKGEYLMVSAAGGGVGTAAVQMGKIRGAKVIALAGSAAKCKLAIDNGADFAIDYNNENMVEMIKKHTNGQGFDVMLDQVGGKIFENALRVMNWGARIMVVGFASGNISKVSVNRLLLKKASIIGVNGFGYLMMEADKASDMWTQLFKLQAQHEKGLKPVLYDHVYPLDKAGDAFMDLNQGKTFGKVVIRVKEEENAKL